MPRVNIPGVGVVNFPDDMAVEDIQAAAARLHRDYTRIPESSEANAPAPRMTRLPTDPSIGGFVSNLVSGAAEAIPRTIKGLARINPLGNYGSAAMAAADMPSAMVQGVKERAGQYADDAAQTIYNDPFAFLEDVSAVAGPAVGAARGGASMAGRAASAVAGKSGNAMKIAGVLAKGAARELPVVGPMARGAVGELEKYLASQSEGAARRATLSGGRLVPKNEQTIRAFADEIERALEKNPALDVSGEPFTLGGSTSGRSSTRGVVLEPQRINTASGEMVATRPDKWGMASIHPSESVESALRSPGSRMRSNPMPAEEVIERGSAQTGFDRYMPNKSNYEMAEGYDRYMPNVSAPETPPPLWNDISPDMPAPQRPLTRRDDAVSRYIGANGGQAELLRELLEAEGMGGFRRLRRPIQ